MATIRLCVNNDTGIIYRANLNVGNISVNSGVQKKIVLLHSL